MKSSNRVGVLFFGVRFARIVLLLNARVISRYLRETFGQADLRQRLHPIVEEKIVCTDAALAGLGNTAQR